MIAMMVIDLCIELSTLFSITEMMMNMKKEQPFQVSVKRRDVRRLLYGVLNRGDDSIKAEVPG